ncbi:hypothetical protein [Paucisalibacillus globulus]|uniref:hypothetical protein n=1 Tax=Paucisalibacillus globulus TaxID=351095 RepID=UPI00047B8F42|nr:hypothetical protein [Paucisalibacillus globulus]
MLIAFLYVFYKVIKMGVGIFNSPEKTSMAALFSFFMEFVKLQIFLFVLFALRKIVNKFYDRMIERELQELNSYDFYEK